MAKEIKKDLSGQKETRVLQFEEAEVRVAEGDSPAIEGFAAKFNRWSENLGGFREKIAKGAFTDSLKTSDVRALKNHDSNMLLGRTKSGTLSLEETPTGLKFRCDMPDTTVGRDTMEEIRRGDLSGCSFAFTIEEDEWHWQEDAEPEYERTIIKVSRLYDVGPVTYPAYPDTTVAARSLEAYKDQLPEPEPDPEPDPDPEPEPRKFDEEAWEVESKYRKLGYKVARLKKEIKDDAESDD